ncbi:MAG: alpha/beta hydrolase [Selenomonadaceae bacterium]|nr:alpha/beta hydrolase [Selenomonadaceae bacterium]
MEANKIKGEAKSIVLDNGVELTYCERGEQNKEVILSGAFYFHTFMPVLECLAEKYHVYGIVMRFDGKTDQLNADGTTHWARQWGSDVLGFAEKMGIGKFHYVGKCHGTVPGWYILKNRPEMLETFASFFLAPHVKGQNSNRWFELLSGGDATEMMRAAMRKPEGVKAKMAEMAAIGNNVTNPAVPQYAGSPETVWDSIEECEKALKEVTVPVGYLFGTEDPLFDDFLDSNMFAIRNTKGARTVILGGERHLMELDCPERVVNEVFTFIEESRKNY